jgi:hypothetical protein
MAGQGAHIAEHLSMSVGISEMAVKAKFEHICSLVLCVEKLRQCGLLVKFKHVFFVDPYPLHDLAVIASATPLRAKPFY